MWPAKVRAELLDQLRNAQEIRENPGRQGQSFPLHLCAVERDRPSQAPIVIIYDNRDSSKNRWSRTFGSDDSGFDAGINLPALLHLANAGGGRRPNRRQRQSFYRFYAQPLRD